MSTKSQLTSEVTLSRKLFVTKSVAGLGLLSVIAFATVRPMVISQYKKAAQTHAVSSCRQFGCSLYEFSQDYGELPSANTVAAVRARTGTTLALGTSTSNDFFRQLIASGVAVSETFFYADIAGARKPDGEMEGISALEKGECGFSYVTGLSSKDNPSKPVVLTPLIPGTDRFDSKPFRGKAVVLELDNSVRSDRIEKDGHVLRNGTNFLAPAHPIWAGEKWTLAWPE